MKFTAKQIAESLQGTVEGNADVWVNNVSKIEEGKPNTLSFLANPKYEEYIYNTKASIVLVNKTFVAQKKIDTTLIRVDDAYQSFAALLEIYNNVMQNKSGIEQPVYIAASSTQGQNIYLGAFAYLGENSVIGNHVKIYPHAYIGDNVTIGDNTTIHAGVKIYSQCVIGSNCTIHAGVVIGADGFGFAPQGEGYKKVPQIGNVIIEDHVEIGANTAIDRATLGSTIIRKGAKLDNLIQIAHNVEIGENTVIAGHSAIAGSSKIGKNVMIGGQAGVIGHLSVADGVKIAGQSGVGQSIDKENEIVQGSPAFSIGDYRKSYVMFRKLPEIEKRLSALEKK
ncbi:MAG TPA: UDP-3-O-(3-hydroxymyristoyl)glucosamine N-acyltransferase [Bacteroidia bacterium]|nr:UDP-3-O-(3-hydroxymyristoyl)glucosamine N-acyltransferase [Bacteroidia bacterium]